ncbi:MAG: hypothetical protein ACRDTE_24130 [Pseudonocardiaceae bacterium]
MSDPKRAEPAGWRDRQPLTGTDMTDFLALRRMCGHPDSRVDQVEDQYVENGRPVLPFLADGLTALIEVGHLTLGEPDSASGSMRPLMVTASGRARYEDLCDRQGLPAYPVTQTADGTPTPLLNRARW